MSKSTRSSSLKAKKTKTAKPLVEKAAAEKERVQVDQPAAARTPIGFYNNAKPLCDAAVPLRLRMRWRVRTSNGFIMSRAQFDHLTEKMRELVDEGDGYFTLRFYQRSGHVVKGKTRRTVYPLVALSTDFEYYNWRVDVKLAREWATFADSIRYVSADYVSCASIAPGKVLTLRIVDSDGGDRIAPAHIGMGRVYHEPAAEEYTVQQGYDTVVN